jgi:hypothetical protein
VYLEDIRSFQRSLPVQGQAADESRRLGDIWRMPQVNYSLNCVLLSSSLPPNPPTILNSVGSSFLRSCTSLPSCVSYLFSYCQSIYIYIHLYIYNII